MSQVSVLSLDDKDVMTQSVLASYFSPQWKVELVSSYQESVVVLNRHPFDVLLLDYDLGPDSPTGVQLIPRYVKAFPNLVIIMMTQKDDIEVMKQAFSLGAEDYIIKSSSVCAEVSIKIRECLKRVRNRKND